MSAETTSTTVTEAIRQAAYASSVLYFSTKPGVTGFVTKMDLTGQETLTARFLIYDAVTATAIAENTDFTTNSQVDTTGSVDVTVSEHAIRFIVTALSLGASVDQIANGTMTTSLQANANQQGTIVGRMAAEAMQTRQDKDVTALFASFDSSTGSNTGAITTTLFQSALTTLESNNIPGPYVAVLHPFQWGSLRVAFSNAATYGVRVGEDVIQRGATAQVAGVDIFTTGNVGTATVSSSTVYAAAMFNPSAIAVAQKGNIPEIAVDLDISLRAVEVVGTGVWGEAEYRGGATTNGRGGAAVFLYSNSTVA